MCQCVLKMGLGWGRLPNTVAGAETVILGFSYFKDNMCRLIWFATICRNEYKTDLKAEESCQGIGILWNFVLVPLLTLRFTLEVASPSHGFRDSPHVCSSQMCIIPLGCLAGLSLSHIHCVFTWTVKVLRPVLQCTVPPPLMLRSHISLPLPC